MPNKKYKYNEIDFKKQLKDYYAVKDKISEHIFPLDDEKLRAAVKEQMPDKWEEYKNFDGDILAFLLYEHYIYKWFYDEFNPQILDEFIILQDEHIAKEKGDNKPLHPHKVS